VRGASKGEGLGNQFLAHIREVDAIAHVLRCFEDSDITHVEGKIDPLADSSTVETELMLADLDSLEKRVDALEKKARGNDKESILALDLVRRAIVLLSEGKPARLVAVSRKEEQAFAMLGLITAEAHPLCLQRRRSLGRERQRILEKSRGEGEERGRGLGGHFRQDRVGDRDAAAGRARRLSRCRRPQGARPRPADPPGYGLLDLVTYFTAGPKESARLDHHARHRAPQAAGVIHTDFEKGFIRAETIAYDDYVSGNGEAGARESGSSGSRARITSSSTAT